MREFKHRERLNLKINSALKKVDQPMAQKIITERFLMNHGDPHAIERLRALLKKV